MMDIGIPRIECNIITLKFSELSQISGHMHAHDHKLEGNSCFTDS